MLLKGTKGYTKDKIKKNFNKYSLYFNSDYIFNNNDSYIIENNIIYKIDTKIKYVDKLTFIKDFGKDKFMKIISDIKKYFKKDETNKLYGLSLLSSSNLYGRIDKYKIPEKLLMKNINYILQKGVFHINFFNDKNFINKYIRIKDIYSDNEDFLSDIQKINKDAYKSILYALGYEFTINHEFSNILKEKIENFLQMSLNHYSISIHNGIKSILIDNIQDYIIYKGEYGVIHNKLFDRQQNSFILEMLDKNNIKEGIIYTGNYLLKNLNKLKDFENNSKLHTYKYEIPSWYKKIENKKYRGKENHKLKRAILKGDLDNFGLNNKIVKNHINYL